MAVAKKQGRPSTRKSEKHIATTLSEVAEFFGMSLSGIYHWRTEAEPMPGGEGKYDLSEIAQWRLNRTGGNGLREEKDRADIRLKTVQAQQKELDLEIQKGNLLERSAVELWAAQFIIAMRDRLLTLPDTLATSTPPEIREFYRSESERAIIAELTTLERELDVDEIEREVSPISEPS